MMEATYNLFLFVDDEILLEVGIEVHTQEGTDKQKIQFLKVQAATDLTTAKRFGLPAQFKLEYAGKLRNAIDYTSYRDLVNQGHALLVFEKAFDELNVAQNPLTVVTPVRNGKIYIEGVEDLMSPDQPPPDVIHIQKQDPWYSDYMIDGKLHIEQLVNDDFFGAVRLLYNAKLYVSAMKLLVICLDTIAFLEYGDVNGNFVNWIDTYMDVTPMGVSSAELWEFRNSVLHMTNLDSRKVIANKVRRLMFYVSGEKAKYLDESDEGKYFRFKDLIDALAHGIVKWGNSFNIDKNKFEKFFERYDRIISDKRMTSIYYTNNF